MTDDAIAKREVSTETISIGMKLSASLGKVVPYVDFSYDTEDITVAAFKTEAGADGAAADLKASAYDSSMRIGAGLNFMLGSHLTGGVRAGQVTGRDDWSESYFAGSISLGF